MVDQHLFVLHGKIPQTGSHVCMSCRPRLFQHLIDAWILFQCLNECADGIFDHITHLAVELGKFSWLVMIIDPGFVSGEIKFRTTHQEIAGAKAFKGFQPAGGPFQVFLKSVDIG